MRSTQHEALPSSQRRVRAPSAWNVFEQRPSLRLREQDEPVRVAEQASDVCHDDAVLLARRIAPEDASVAISDANERAPKSEPNRGLREAIDGLGSSGADGRAPNDGARRQRIEREKRCVTDTLSLHHRAPARRDVVARANHRGVTVRDVALKSEGVPDLVQRNTGDLLLRQRLVPVQRVLRRAPGHADDRTAHLGRKWIPLGAGCIEAALGDGRTDSVSRRRLRTGVVELDRDPLGARRDALETNAEPCRLPCPQRGLERGLFRRRGVGWKRDGNDDACGPATQEQRERPPSRPRVRGRLIEMAARRRGTRAVPARQRVAIDGTGGAAGERDERDERAASAPQTDPASRLGSSAVALPVTTGSPF